MNVHQYAVQVIGELEQALTAVDAQAAERLADHIQGANRVFVAGAGRSGFMCRAFAMRLMHMGITAYVVGETATPGIGQGDLLLICSGSGETGSLAGMAGKASGFGALLALVTIFPQSTIGALADVVVRIPAPTPKGKQDAAVHSVQPMGSLFEQSLLLFLDCIILRLMEKRGQNSDTMFLNHANLE